MSDNLDEPSNILDFPIPNHSLGINKSIFAFIHCNLCLEEIPEGISPKDYQQIQCGWTFWGLQIWCDRHDRNILHIDFEGIKHPARIDCKNNID